MDGYLRPPIESPVFHDEDGAPIPYGRRWDGGDPTPESYSRTSHLDRFLPLHDVAEALIAHLVEHYAVGVDDDLGAASDLIHPRDDVVRAIRLTPADAAAAPLTFVFTSFPSVILHAGALHDFLFPVCGCDACDEGVEYLADELEWHVQAVVDGGYREQVVPSSGHGVAFSLSVPGVGSQSGSARADDLPREAVAAALAALPPGGMWAPWPRRPAPIS
ncbi:hypothetical protein BCL57_000805 [Agromyces flavus]|uniref:Uncharacterized protein n=1 Tax=Agromyces flavus TaxID=589382 RepID=A0A1H1YEI3_9MICO|nr:DUF6226 family protein [Agromyces flavus]MCP2366663.1 hypothetical protein [Agromyces flavus]GGI45126.1 hypothetical protein GCM10010932_08060 [Agromyces flavus]SDT19791.1 hypothetical protein SAMN04489721_2738 [Agromyces flavus]